MTVSLRVVIDEVDAWMMVMQLVNYILHAQHRRRIAVILNDFGDELGIEKAMVNDGDGGALVEEWVELGNGCVCCSLSAMDNRKAKSIVTHQQHLDNCQARTTPLHAHTQV